MLGPTTREQQEALWDYGLNIGMAFQIVDDLLDFTGEEAALGKPVGGDLREGKMTLPVIHLLAPRRRAGGRAGAPDRREQDVTRRGLARAPGAARADALDRLRTAAPPSSSSSAPRSALRAFPPSPSPRRADVSARLRPFTRPISERDACRTDQRTPHASSGTTKSATTS